MPFFLVGLISGRNVEICSGLNPIHINLLGFTFVIGVNQLDNISTLFSNLPRIQSRLYFDKTIIRNDLW